MGKYRERTNEEKMKQIAIWKTNHPEASTKDLSKKFKLSEHKIRYAIEKYAERSAMLKNTKLGRIAASKFVAASGDDIELLRQQLNFCLAELETNAKMAISSRIDMLYKIMRIRVYLQDVEIQNHIKSTDAELIALIIRRYEPAATNDDVIKIYNEVYLKWKSSHS